MGRKLNLEALRGWGTFNAEDIEPPELLVTYTLKLTRGCYYITLYISAFRNGSWMVSIPDFRRCGRGESLAEALEQITNSYT